MYINYDRFEEILNGKILHGQDFYDELLLKLIQYPGRYSGLFRLSNAKTKLIQNITQSIEIKFGDFLEDLVTEYIDLFGYTNLPKNLGINAEGDNLNADQLFKMNSTIYFIEQKVRDDHDSTKKRGQWENFLKKIRRIKIIYPNHNIVSAMWFVDPSLKKNRKYYQNQMDNLSIANVEAGLYYGEELFDLMLSVPEAWNELTNNLRIRRLENSDGVIEIEDLDSSIYGKKAILNLTKKNLTKLCSTNDEYKLLRQELFKIGYNFKSIIEDETVLYSKRIIISSMYNKDYRE